jgi:hypothetical protein
MVKMPCSYIVHMPAQSGQATLANEHDSIFIVQFLSVRGAWKVAVKGRVSFSKSRSNHACLIKHIAYVETAVLPVGVVGPVTVPLAVV